MSKKILVIAFFFVLAVPVAKSQYINLSDEPDLFIEQADSLLKQWGNIGDSTSNNFSAVWFDLSDSDQEKVIAISRVFRERKYRVNPFFVAFYSALYNAVNGDFSDRVNMSDFLDVAQKVIENTKTPREILRYFLTARNLFDHGALYYSGYNVLNVPEGSSFVFEYVEPSDYFEPAIPDEVEAALLGEDTTSFEEETEDEWGDDDWGDDDWDDDSWDDDSWDDDSWDDDGWGEDDELADFDDDENMDNYDGFGDSFDPLGMSAPVVDLPPIEGATIKIENADFEIFSPYDTFEIRDVTGTYVFGSRSFVGDTGIVPITIPFGEFEAEAEVTFGKFAFNTINPNLSAENAVLSFSELFDEEISGSFVMRSVEPRPSGKRYPTFRSYKSNYQYKDIGEGVELTGGFTLIGRNISTQGQDLGKNYIEIRKDEELILKGSAQRFFIRDTLLNTHRMNLVMYQNEDSLYHPSMGMKYNMSNNLLNLYWEEGMFKERPMVNTYHEVEVIADKLWWDLNTRQINFGIIQGRSEVPAIVRSLDNFDDQEYLRVKGIHKFHPVQAAAYFAKKKYMDEFSFFELAEAYRIEPDLMKKAVITAASKGYLDFDPSTGLIRLNYKTKHAYNSNFKKGDFDNMEWYSISPTGRNITMDLDSGDMIIRGVEKEIVSKALKVFYRPDSGIVVLKQGRNFSFDGEVEAGNYKIKGKDFGFDYNSFNIQLTHIDSIRFDLQNDSTGESSQRKILGGQVENTGGWLYLNEPNNKSGNRKLPQYPILNVTEPSYVYFDDPDILGGVYDQRMYFEIPNFSIDTIESDNPSVINLDGTFHSSGLLPDFQTTLGVNPDLSLGFTYEVPEEGFTVFENDEAKFYNTIKMSKEGLTGSGTFKYLTSKTETEDVTFYQDSMVVNSGVIDVEAVEREHGGYPDAQCADARGVLMASNERYIINSKGRELVQLYEGEAQLDGAAMISKKGMFGIGTVRTKGTDSKSRNFKFSETSFTGRQADFFIEAVDQDTFALSANNAKLFFDFTQNTAQLEPEIKGDAVISMPLMYYKTSIPVGVWDLDEQTFTMEKPEGVDIEDSYFYSTLEDQDSLVFSGSYAVYDAVAYNLTVKGVPGINVADAYITPGDSTVIIDETALIQPLEGASIAMNQTERWHFLNEAEVDIYSSNRFDGLGTYKYVNSGGDTMDIAFEDLIQEPEQFGKKKTDSVTVGESYVEEEPFFYIAPKIIYQGDVNLFANREFLEFNGEIRLDLKHSDEFNDWLPFQFAGDPNDIRIELKDERELEEGEPLLTTGIHVDGGESQMYYTFLSSKRMDEDPDIFRVTGFLSIDSETGEFKIGDEDKLTGQTKKGNLFVYNDSSSMINFEGEFDLYGYLPEEIAAHSYGSGLANIESGEYSYNTLTYLNFPIPGAALNEFGSNMAEEKSFTVGLQEATDQGYDLIFNLSQMIGEKAAESYDEQLYMEYIPLYMTSGKFGKSILFADLDLKWHQEEGALYSGDSVGLASIGKNDINAKIRGYYEVKKLYEDEIVNLFLELAPNSWLYISYDNGRLASFSSSHYYNMMIEGKAKTPESGNSQGELYLASADLYEVVDYVKYYNETYLGRTLKDEDINLKVSKPEEDDLIGRELADEDYEKPKKEEGWGEDYDDGWGGEDEDADDGWGADDEEDEGGWGDPIDEESEEEDDNIETTPESSNQEDNNSGWGADEDEDSDDGWGADEEEDDGWGGYEDEEDSNAIVGAPPKKAKKEKKRKDKKPKEIPVLDEFEEEEKEDEPETKYGGWGSDDDEDEDDGWGGGGWGSDDEDKDDGWGTDSDNEEEPKEVKTETKEEPVKKEPESKKDDAWGEDKEDDDDGWGFGDDEEEEDEDGWGFEGEDEEDNSAELKAKEEADKKAKEEAERKAREEEERLAKEAADKKAEEERKAKEEAERKQREEEERQRQLEEEKEEEEEDDGWGFDDDEEEDDDGWGFDGEDEDNSEDQEAEDLKAKEEADRKAKEEADRIAREEAERKAREEEERLAKEAAEKKAEEERKAKEAEEQKAKEEEERKKREEEERQRALEKEKEEEEDDDDGWGFDDDEEDDDDGWGFDGDDTDEEESKKEDEAEAAKKTKEEAEKKAKEEEEKRKQEEALKKKAEEEKKRKEEEEKKKKEEEAKESETSEEEEEEDDWDGF